MSDLREAAKLALIALENGTSPNLWLSTKENLRQALSQPEQEPVAWGFRRIKDGAILDIKNADFEHEGYEEIYTVPLYTAPPKRGWVGLPSDEEILEISKCAWGESELKYGRDDHRPFYIAFARAIEAKLKEKNT